MYIYMQLNLHILHTHICIYAFPLATGSFTESDWSFTMPSFCRHLFAQGCWKLG